MSYVVIALFALGYLAATLAWRVPIEVGAFYLGASALCFIVYAFDKAAARGGHWRISERSLLLCGLVCGWPGALLAQQWLRHKSSKISFRRKFWLTVALNVAAFVWLAAQLAGWQPAILSSSAS
jgi:uncharacterized membrane protein YsdA (DUF1294 family)